MIKDRVIIFALIYMLFPSSTQTGGSFRTLLNSWNMIPSQSLAGLYYLFKGYSFEDEEGVLRVSGPVVEITQGERLGARIHRDGFMLEKSPEDFEEEQFLGRSVFEASTRLGTGIGTAFLVGQDLVLTNRHIMNYTPDDRRWECGKFSIKLNHREEQVKCARVRFCSRLHDYCVVQMHKMETGLSLGEELRPLRLSQNVRDDRDAFVLHIGNAGGMGIQASHGRGVKIQGGEVFHYAPTLGGSSGAPIFNEKREVIGINWAYTGHDQIDENAYNRAVLSRTIYQELGKTHPQTLREIRSFRSWHNQRNRHRQARILSSTEKPE